MNPTNGFALLRQAEGSTVTETDVDVVCGNQGPFCDVLYEWTDREMLAEGVSFLLSHIDDPIGYAIRLDDGSEYELAIERSQNPLPVLADQ